MEVCKTRFAAEFLEILEKSFRRRKIRKRTRIDFFWKQPVYKQLFFEWQFAKHLSVLNPVLLVKITELRKVEFFLCNKHKIVVKLTMNQRSAV